MFDARSFLFYFFLRSYQRSSPLNFLFVKDVLIDAACWMALVKLKTSSSSCYDQSESFSREKFEKKFQLPSDHLREGDKNNLPPEDGHLVVERIVEVLIQSFVV